MAPLADSDIVTAVNGAGFASAQQLQDGLAVVLAFAVALEAAATAAGTTVAARAKMQQAKAQFQSAIADLNNIGTTYGPTFTDISNAAAASPSNVALSNNNAEAQALTSEYQALVTVGNNVVAAATV